jgi:hypothetical protein
LTFEYVQCETDPFGRRSFDASGVEVRSEMLAAVKQGRYRDAFIAYKRTFAIAALSRSARRGLQQDRNRVGARHKQQVRRRRRAPRDLRRPCRRQSTAEMLAAVKQGRYRDAFIAYKRTFAIAALSRSLTFEYVQCETDPFGRRSFDASGVEVRSEGVGRGKRSTEGGGGLGGSWARGDSYRTAT